MMMSMFAMSLFVVVAFCSLPLGLLSGQRLFEFVQTVHLEGLKLWWVHNSSVDGKELVGWTELLRQERKADPAQSGAITELIIRL